MSCDYTKTVLCHKRSVTFNKTFQLVEDSSAVPLTPKFPDITGWKIHVTLFDKGGTELTKLTTDGLDMSITVIDGVNNIFTLEIADDVLFLLPPGTIQADMLFYDDDELRRGTQDFLIKLEKELTVPVII